MILPEVTYHQANCLEKTVKTSIFKDSKHIWKQNNQENFKNVFKKSPTALNILEGRLIEGIILSIKGKVLIIDIGLKMTVKFPLDELPKERLAIIKVGDSIQFQIEQLETYDVEMVLNYDRAQKDLKQKNIWNIIKNNKDHINGIVLNHVDGGYSVGLGGIVAFLPKDQILPMKYKGRIKNNFVGSFKTFYILSVNSARSKKNIIVSRVEAIKHAVRLDKKIDLFG